MPTSDDTPTIDTVLADLLMWPTYRKDYATIHPDNPNGWMEEVTPRVTQGRVAIQNLIDRGRLDEMQTLKKVNVRMFNLEANTLYEIATYVIDRIKALEAKIKEGES